MTKLKPREIAAEARRRNLEQLGRLGGQIRDARLRRRQTQAEAAARAGIARTTWSDMENGRGGGHTLDAWQRAALAVGRPLVVNLQRDALEDTADAGHLAMQELVLRLGRAAGFAGAFELPTRPAQPWRSTDVGLRHDRLRLLALCECWNTFGDIGAAGRSSARKRVEAEALAVAVGGEEPYAVASCWVVRETRRNRALVRRYPEVFRSRFPGSSRAWVELLSGPTDPTDPTRHRDRDAPLRERLLEPALVWCDTDAARIFEWRPR
jgi:transcriptional regulator with XRE-family HTH domain